MEGIILGIEDPRRCRGLFFCIHGIEKNRPRPGLIFIEKRTVPGTVFFSGVENYGEK
jgi:hypothetical protein